MKWSRAMIGWGVGVLGALVLFAFQFLPIVRYLIEDLTGARLIVVLPVVGIFSLVFFLMAVILLAGPIVFWLPSERG